MGRAAGVLATHSFFGVVQYPLGYDVEDGVDEGGEDGEGEGFEVGDGFGEEDEDVDVEGEVEGEFAEVGVGEE